MENVHDTIYSLTKMVNPNRQNSICYFFLLWTKKKKSISFSVLLAIFVGIIGMVDKQAWISDVPP